jgi:hypothetical protein
MHWLRERAVKVEKEMKDEVARDGGDTPSGIGRASLFWWSRVFKHRAWIRKDENSEQKRVPGKTCGYYRCTLSQPIQASDVPVVRFLHSEWLPCRVAPLLVQ